MRALRLLLALTLPAFALGKLDAAVASRIARAKSGQPGNPLSPPGLDPFDKVALVNTYFLCKERIPAAWGKPWSGNDMLWCEARRNGWILETSELAPFSGGGPDAELDRFAAAILGRTRVDASGLDQPGPRLRFTSLGGHRLDLTWLPHRQPYAGQAKIDGQAVDYPSWPLHGNPWVRQRPVDPALGLKHGRDRLSYDSAKWTRREWRDDGP